MPNLYGVSTPTTVWQNTGTIGFADIPCPAGVETNVWSVGPIIANCSGYYWVWIIGSFTISIGATPPGSYTYGARIGAGSDFASGGSPAQLLIANSNFLQPINMQGSISESLWRAPGSTVNVSFNPTGQGITVRGSGSGCSLVLMRAPDQ